MLLSSRQHNCLRALIQNNFRTIDIKSKKKGHKKLRYLHNPIIAENAESIGANQSEVSGIDKIVTGKIDQNITGLIQASSKRLLLLSMTDFFL